MTLKGGGTLYSEKENNIKKKKRFSEFNVEGHEWSAWSTDLKLLQENVNQASQIQFTEQVANDAGVTFLQMIVARKL